MGRFPNLCHIMRCKVPQILHFPSSPGADRGPQIHGIPNGAVKLLWGICLGMMWKLLAGNKSTFRNLQQFVNVPLMKIQLFSSNNQFTPGTSSSLQGIPGRDSSRDLGLGTPGLEQCGSKNPWSKELQSSAFLSMAVFIV